MVTLGLLQARMVLSCLKKLRFFFTRFYQHELFQWFLMYNQKGLPIAFPVFQKRKYLCQCSAIDPVGDRNGNSENADVKCYSLLQCFFLTGLVSFCALYSWAFLYWEDGRALSIISVKIMRCDDLCFSNARFEPFSEQSCFNI